jgi:EmrB/QacA subfamily drug resistance transporter
VFGSWTLEGLRSLDISRGAINEPGAVRHYGRNDPDPRRWLALAVLSFTILLISLDSTVLTVAIPTLVENLHPSASGLQWIANSFVLTQAMLLVAFGAVGDRIGRRRMFLTGSVVFGAGSALCALAGGAGVLIAGRVVTGVGGSMLAPASLSTIAATFPLRDRPKAIGILMGMTGVGAAAGPLIGGWLLQHFWWGSVFVINLPVAVVACVGGFLFVSESRAEKKSPLDLIGVALAAIGLLTLTYALIAAPDQGWLSGPVVGSLAAAALLLGAFAFWEVHTDDPLVDFGLFKNPTFSTALGAVAAAFFSILGINFLLSQYVQFVQRADVFAVGLRFLPSALGTLIGANAATRLSNRFGVRAVVLIGMVLTAAAAGIYSTLQVSLSPIPIMTAFWLGGLGLGLVIAPASNAVVGTLPPDKVGAGSGLRSTVQLLGASFGVAVIGDLTTTRYRSQIDHALSGPLGHLPPGARSAIASQIGGATSAADHLPPDVASKVTAAADSAFVSGVRLGALVALAVMVVALGAVARYFPSAGPDLRSVADPVAEPMVENESAVEPGAL